MVLHWEISGNCGEREREEGVIVTGVEGLWMLVFMAALEQESSTKFCISCEYNHTSFSEPNSILYNPKLA